MRPPPSFAVLLLALATGTRSALAAEESRDAADEASGVLVVALAWALTDEERATLLASCDAAYATGMCREGAASSEAPLWGRVESTSGDHVVLELHVSDRFAQRDVSRELTFRAEDGSLERAKAVGLTLGVIATTLAESLSQGASEQTPTDRTDTEPRDEARRPSWTMRTSVLAGIARDPDLSGIEGAASVRGQLRPSEYGVRFRGAVDGSHASLESLGLTRVAPTLGLGWSVAAAPLDLTLALDGGAEWLQVHAEGDEDSDEASRWSPVFRGSVSAALALSPRFGLDAAAQLSWTTSPTTAFVGGRRVERTSGLLPALLVGFYVHFGPTERLPSMR